MMEGWGKHVRARDMGSGLCVYTFLLDAAFWDDVMRPLWLRWYILYHPSKE
jgi:hypothetical protein